MSEDEILVRKDGPIAWITLNRPEKRNAQGLTFTTNMLTALDRVENDAEVAVAVLTANGPVFGGGGDLKEIMSVEQQDPEQELELIRGYNKVISRLYYLSRPIIAAVNGPAFGGGTCLALACDFAIASERAEYHFVFARIGLSAADMGAPFLLQRHLGAARAARYLLTAARVGAEEGKVLGLFADVVLAERLTEETRRIAIDIAGQSRRATTITKLALRRSTETTFDAALEYDAYLQSFAFRSEGHKQRLKAFLDKSRKA
jgi:enoyl-CoA hydratase/carnithine racemase